MGLAEATDGSRCCDGGGGGESLQLRFTELPVSHCNSKMGVFVSCTTEEPTTFWFCGMTERSSARRMPPPGASTKLMLCGFHERNLLAHDTRQRSREQKPTNMAGTAR